MIQILSHRAVQVLLIAVFIGAGIWYWHTSWASLPRPVTSGVEGTNSAAAQEPVATITVTPLTRQNIKETLTAYGTTEAAPGESQRFSVPYECRIRKVRVTPGQAVQDHMPLIDIEPSQETKLQMDSARGQRAAAWRQLKLIRQRLQMNLVTRQDLLLAQQNFRAVQIRVQSLEKRGAAHLTTLHATSTGIVSVISVREGQIIPAGTSLMETINRNKIVVRLGIELENVALLHSGQAVRLIPVHRPVPQPIEGQIRLIAQGVNILTRLVDILVAPGPQTGLLLNEYVRGKIVVGARDTFVVPREAVVPTTKGYLLYTVNEGLAVAHPVNLGLETDHKVEIKGDTLKEGQPVAIVGSSQLHNGMAVTIASTP